MKRKEAEQLVAGIERGFEIIRQQEERQITIDAFMVLTSTLAAIAQLCYDSGFTDLFNQVEEYVNVMANLLDASATGKYSNDEGNG